MKCRFCGQELTHEFIDLGFAPPSNAYLTKAQLQEPEVYYPLKVWVCDSCFLVQIDECKKSAEIFSKEYKYFSSYSTSWLKHCKDYVDMITERLKLDSKSHVTEIASNDGYLLQYFVEKGISCVGVEPSGDTADVAISKGINTYKEFFTESFAWTIQSSDLIIGNNVLAHVPNINDFVAGLKVALKENGTITMEFPHILNLIKYNQFDTCLLPESKIISEMGFINIEDLKIGDKVLSHTGKFKQVTHTFKKEYAGDQFDIYVYGQSTPLRVTDEHPILVYSSGVTKWVESKNIHAGDIILKPRVSEYSDDIKTVSVQHLKSCGCRESEERTKTFIIDTNLMKIAGYFLAEGGYQCRGRNSSSAQFSFGHTESEKMLAEDCANSLISHGAKGRLYYTIYGWHVETYGPIAKMLSEQFGNGAKNKKLPSWIYYLSDDLTKILIESYCKGDGYSYRDGQYWRAGTISEELAQGMAILSNKIGWACSINKYKQPQPRFIHKNKKITLNQSPTYDILIKKYIKRKCKTWIDGQFQYSLVKKIEKNEYSGIVYNLEVEGDNSYTTPCGVVHNCYHEHYSYLSLTTVIKIFDKHDLKIYDVEELPTHGGSLRIYASHRGNLNYSLNYGTSRNLYNVLQEEKEYNLDKLEGYQNFKYKALSIKYNFIEFVTDLMQHDKTIAGYGSAAKGNTFLNYIGVSKDIIPFIVDKSPYKQWTFTPGSHIPVVDIDVLERTKPDFIIIFPWNIKEEIMEELSFIREWGGKFVTFIPELEII